MKTIFPLVRIGNQNIAPINQIQIAAMPIPRPMGATGEWRLSGSFATDRGTTSPWNQIAFTSGVRMTYEQLCPASFPIAGNPYLTTLPQPGHQVTFDAIFSPFAAGGVGALQQTSFYSRPGEAVGLAMSYASAIEQARSGWFAFSGISNNAGNVTCYAGKVDLVVSCNTTGPMPRLIKSAPWFNARWGDPTTATNSDSINGQQSNHNGELNSRVVGIANAGLSASDFGQAVATVKASSVGQNVQTLGSIPDTASAVQLNLLDMYQPDAFASQWNDTLFYSLHWMPIGATVGADNQLSIAPSTQPNAFPIGCCLMIPGGWYRWSYKADMAAQTAGNLLTDYPNGGFNLSQSELGHRSWSSGMVALPSGKGALLLRSWYCSLNYGSRPTTQILLGLTTADAFSLNASYNNVDNITP